MSFARWYKFMVRWEGGYSNDKYDLGGETNKGVTWKTFLWIAPRLGIPPTREVFLAMPQEVHERIARFFYDMFKGVPWEGLRFYLADFRWGSGGAIKVIQKELNRRLPRKIEEDGIWGPETEKSFITWVNIVGPCVALKKLDEWRRKYVLEYVPKVAPQTRRFVRGWRRRINEGYEIAYDLEGCGRKKNSS